MDVYDQHILVGLLICWFVATIKLTDQPTMLPYDQPIIFQASEVDSKCNLMTGDDTLCRVCKVYYFFVFT